jgi:hypothetical protein
MLAIFVPKGGCQLMQRCIYLPCKQPRSDCFAVSFICWACFFFPFLFFRVSASSSSFSSSLLDDASSRDCDCF